MSEEKRAALLAGSEVVCSDAELDALTDDDRFRDLRSSDNPRRVGVHDAYLAKFAPFDGAMP